MSTFQGRYLGQLRTQTQHTASGETLITDAPVDNHGRGEAFSPTDLLATALATCMATIMGIKAQQMDVDLSDMHYHIEKHMHAAPRKVGRIVVHFRMPAHLDAKTLQVLEHVARHCPVALSLSSEVEQEITFTQQDA